MDQLFFNPWIEVSMAFFAAMLVMIVALNLFRLKKSGKKTATYTWTVVAAAIAYGAALLFFIGKKGGVLDSIYFITVVAAVGAGLFAFLILYKRK